LGVLALAIAPACGGDGDIQCPNGVSCDDATLTPAAEPAGPGVPVDPADDPEPDDPPPDDPPPPAEPPQDEPPQDEPPPDDPPPDDPPPDDEVCIEEGEDCEEWSDCCEDFHCCPVFKICVVDWWS
jgi:hypothetical protein